MAEMDFEIMNSLNMNAKCGRHASVPQYISVFRIDGVPILPPLMTSEKRRLMQKLKEKAVKIEAKLDEYRHRKENYNLAHCSVSEDSTDQTEDITTKLNNSSSSRKALDHDAELDMQRKEVEKSYLMLTDLLTQNKNDAKDFTPTSESHESEAGFFESHSSQLNLMQRMQKLKKSATLIYDYRSGMDITPLSVDENHSLHYAIQEKETESESKTKNVVPTAVWSPKRNKSDFLNSFYNNTNNNGNPDFVLNLESAPKIFSEKTLKKIPSICIDPPTPINGSRTLSDAITAQNIGTDPSNVTKHDKSTRDVNKTLHDELSSDESRKNMEPTTKFERDLKAHRKVTRITSKILKFETFPVSEADEDLPKNIKLPQRSATSPSLRVPHTMRTPKPSNKTLEVADGSPSAIGLVRSNSFTLDCPSKALIEHIRQQQTPSTENHPPKPISAINSSILRDTVESKAKRVQKVDLKTRTQTTRLQLKPSTTNNTSPSSTYQTSGSNKGKRSPYESKSVKPKIGRQFKKSISGTSAIKQMKPRASMPSIQTATLTTATVMTPASERVCNLNYNALETEHRKKFMELLAHQKREQRRMQQVFEKQQQFLLEQLTAKMGCVNVHQPATVNSPGSSTSAKARPAIMHHNSVDDNSPTAKSSDNHESIPPQSPTTSFNSSMASELTSLELSARSSNVAAISQRSNTHTPRRRLFSPSTPNKSVSGGGVSVGNAVGRSSSSDIEPSDSSLKFVDKSRYEEANRREAAATKINAYVRGYLVRRLFQTEQIQRIVQTIKDTLMFVLSFHMETFNDPKEAKSPNNIMLKGQLWRQLTSASRTLHLILFNTSIKERMEIIGRDRKRIQTRMLTMNLKRSPGYKC